MCEEGTTGGGKGGDGGRGEQVGTAGGSQVFSDDEDDELHGVVVPPGDLPFTGRRDMSAWLVIPATCAGMAAALLYAALLTASLPGLSPLTASWQ